MSIPAYRVIGVRVSAATIESLHTAIGSAVEAGSRFVMVSQNLHSVYLQKDHPEIRELQERADCVRIDGMPVLWFAKLSGVPVSRSNRIGWMDWVYEFMNEAQKQGWRIFYVGSKPEVKEEALRRLKQRFPALQISGVNGYFDARSDSADNNAVVEAVRQFKPDILLVGMGMPRQERWLLENMERIDAPVLLTCGAALDYVAGAQKTPPRWMGRFGLEWLYRLSSDPKRMWFRYLVEPWYAVGLYLRSLFGQGRSGE